MAAQLYVITAFHRTLRDRASYRTGWSSFTSAETALDRALAVARVHEDEAKLDPVTGEPWPAEDVKVAHVYVHAYELHGRPTLATLVELIGNPPDGRPPAGGYSWSKGAPERVYNWSGQIEEGRRRRAEILAERGHLDVE